MSTSWTLIPDEVGRMVYVLVGSSYTITCFSGFSEIKTRSPPGPCLLLTFRLASRNIYNIISTDNNLLREGYAQHWHHNITLLYDFFLLQLQQAFPNLCCYYCRSPEGDWKKLTFLRIKRHLMQLRPLETTFSQKFDIAAANALLGIDNSHLDRQMQLAEHLNTVYELLYWRSRVEVLLHDWFEYVVFNATKLVAENFATRLADLASRHTYLTHFHRKEQAGRYKTQFLLQWGWLDLTLLLLIVGVTRGHQNPPCRTGLV